MINPEMGPREPNSEIPQTKLEQETDLELESVDTMDSPVLQEKAVDRTLNYLDEKGSDANFSAALAITGIDSGKAWEIRKKIADTREVVWSTAGIDSKKAWDVRKKFLKSRDKGGEPFMAAESLIGIDSDKAWDMREEILMNAYEWVGYSGGHEYGAVLKSLGGLDSNRAWKMREEHMSYDTCQFIPESLIGLDNDRAWKMREELIKKAGNDQEGIVRNLVGLDSDRAWNLRESLISEEVAGRTITGGAERIVLEGLAGVDSERAWQMREKLLANQGMFEIRAVAESLAGLDSDRAWKMRERLVNMGVDEHFVLIGIYGDRKMVGVRKARHDQIEKAE